MWIFLFCSKYQPCKTIRIIKQAHIDICRWLSWANVAPFVWAVGPFRSWHSPAPQPEACSSPDLCFIAVSGRGNSQNGRKSECYWGDTIPGWSLGQMGAGISVNSLNLPKSMGQDADWYPGQRRSLPVDREVL